MRSRRLCWPRILTFRLRKTLCVEQEVAQKHRLERVRLSARAQHTHVQQHHLGRTQRHELDGALGNTGARERGTIHLTCGEAIHVDAIEPLAVERPLDLAGHEDSHVAERLPKALQHLPLGKGVAPRTHEHEHARKVLARDPRKERALRQHVHTVREALVHAIRLHKPHPSPLPLQHKPNTTHTHAQSDYVRQRKRHARITALSANKDHGATWTHCPRLCTEERKAPKGIREG